MDKKVRVRFAPSPTGYLHIGGARTAIFNYLFARQNNGTFVLRIEDSDTDRSLIDSEGKILEDMQWLGMKWDEGPDINGSFGPYRQTQRLSMYKEYADKLLKEDKAYYCYCTPEELDQERKKAISLKQTPCYSGRCASLKSEEQEKFKTEGRLPAVRFRTPHKTYIVDDLIKGQVEFKEEKPNDFIIMKSDDTPTYNFAVAVDDSLMQISHVIRGDEHLINTPRQIMIYEALGLNIPQFAHIPMILAPDHTKLSKRHGTTSVGEFREKGYLAEALVNYLALLGWSPRDDREFFTLSELIDEFSLERVAKNPAIYDTGKLTWMNFEYIKNLSLEEITGLAVPYLTEAGIITKEEAVSEHERIKNIMEVIRNYVHYLGEAASNFKNFWDEEVLYDAESLEIIKDESGRKVFKALIEALSEYDKVDETNYKDLMNKVSLLCGVKGKNLYMPVRAALIGTPHGPELVKVFKVLGVKRVILRLNRSVKQEV
ncbi:MAG: glutamate--tRNA ligase [Armatimonadota bacterium]